MRDIRTCDSLHQAKAAFQDALMEGAAIQNRHLVARLRQKPVYQQAAFFFLLRAFRLDDEMKIHRYAELHTWHPEELQADRSGMCRLGLSPTRVQRGMFSPDGIPNLADCAIAGRGSNPLGGDERSQINSCFFPGLRLVPAYSSRPIDNPHIIGGGVQPNGTTPTVFELKRKGISPPSDVSWTYARGLPPRVRSGRKPR